jgi:hypothetical protein
MYAIFEDLARAYVGPFRTQEQIDEHCKFCEGRGDGAVYLGNVNDNEVPADAFTLTPEQDRFTTLF